MKLTTLFLIAVYLHVSAAGYGQKVTISGKDMPLEKVFRMIKKQTGYVCFYSYDMLQKTRNVSLDMKDVEIDDVMRACLWDQGMDFSITGKTITIIRKEKKESETFMVSPGHIIKATGTVYNENGQPLSGANVTIKSTGKGAITNAKGEFVLPAVPENSLLVISFIGYAPQTVNVSEGKTIQVYLKVAKNELDKVVIQAYGTTTQRLATGNIATVSAAEIEKQPVINPLLALQGKVAGLNVSQSSGYASAPVKIELRGRSAISSQFTSDPLFIIDGVPLTVLEIGGTTNYYYGSSGFLQSGFAGPATGQSPFFNINAYDIESIEVLKDADATAIYGSRGANGVILVTTKRGKPGKTKLDLHVQSGITKVTRFWKMMNTQQYLQMRREAYKNDNAEPSLDNGAYDLLQWDTLRYTDWQKKIFGGVGKSIDVQAGLSGGDALSTFRLGAGYNRTTNVLTVNGADQRGSLSLNLTRHSIDQRLTVSFTGSYSVAKSDMISMPASSTLPPNAPDIYDSAGNLNFGGWGGLNGAIRNSYPFSSLKQPYTSKTNFLNSSLAIAYQIIRGLKFSTSFGYNNSQANNQQFFPIASKDPLSNPTGNAQWGYSNSNNWIIEPQLNYDRFIGSGKLSVLAGASLQETNTEGIYSSGSGYKSDALIKSISNAPTQYSADNYGKYRYAALYGRITYSYRGKYIVSFNARRDGSSRFGADNQFGNFGSLGVAWNFSEENWIKEKVKFLSFGKLRGSYGTTGSDGVGDYQYLTRWSSNSLQPYGDIQPIGPIQHYNPSFHWQVNKKLEFALQLGFLKDRIEFMAAYYRNRCGDQLVGFPTPTLSGFSSVTANSPALVQNSGLEFTLSTDIVASKNFTWSINFNASINQNKLLAYPNLDQSPYAYTLVVGKPLNVIYLLHYTGVDPQTGQYTFKDKNHDDKITLNPNHPDDDSYDHNLDPKLFGGLGMNFNYKGIELNLFFNMKKQIGRNALGQLPSTPGQLGNQPVSLIGQEWKKPGDIATVAMFTNAPSDNTAYFAGVSDGIYTDASFIRLSNVSLSYALPATYVKKLGIQNCSIFFHTNNLFVITKYKGLDPETQVFGGMPPYKTIVGGMSFTF